MDVETTYAPNQSLGVPKPKLSSEFLGRLGSSCVESISVTRGQRSELIDTLDYWNDMAEMNVAPRNDPWPNATNLCVPIAATMMESVQSKVASAVYVPRIYVISPLTDEATPYSQKTENFYNARWHQEKWILPHLAVNELETRDGVAIMEVLWEKRVSTRNVVKMEPNGELNADGTPKKIKTFRKVRVVEHNGPRLEAIELRDFMLVPAVARSIEEADEVWVRKYYSEQDLLNMSSGDSPDLDRAQVEKILAFHTTGQSDLASGVDSTTTYEQAGVLQLGDSGTNDPLTDDNKPTKSRGLFEIWRGHVKDYDLDGDGHFEENVIWLHEPSQIVAGWGPYEYFHGKRPFVKFALMPRANRFQGWSVPERVRPFQEEANAQRNKLGDAFDIKILPPFYHTSGAKVVDKDRKYGPGAEWEVTKKDDVGVLDMGTMDLSVLQDLSVLYSFAGRMVGLESPSLPLYGNQRMSQKQQGAHQTGTNVRIDLMCLYERLSCQEVLEQIHALYLQYGDDDEENELGGHGLEALEPQDGGGFKKLHLPMEALAQDHRLGVAGTEGALDKENQMDQVMTMYALLLQNPLVQGNLPRVHAVTSMVLDARNIPTYERFIGTPEEAQQQQEQMAQAAQKAHEEQMALQIASHSKVDTSKAGGESNFQPQPGAPQPVAAGPPMGGVGG